MADLPKGFGIDVDNPIAVKPGKARPPRRDTKKVPPPNKSPKRKPTDEGKEDASSKRLKITELTDPTVQTFLGAASSKFFSEEEVKGWSSRSDEQIENVLISSAAQLHFHANHIKESNQKMRARLSQLETENKNMSKQLKGKDDQFKRMRSAKDTQIEKLNNSIKSMTESIDKLTKANSLLEEDKSNGWAVEKKALQKSSFSRGFRNYASGFLAVDPEYDFSKFGQETVDWIEKFKIDEADEIKAKRISLGLELPEVDEDASPDGTPILEDKIPTPIEEQEGHHNSSPAANAENTKNIEGIENTDKEPPSKDASPVKDAP